MTAASAPARRRTHWWGLVALVLVAALSPWPAGAGSAGVGPAAGEGTPYNGWHYARGGRAEPPPARAFVLPDGRTAHDSAFAPFAAVQGVTVHHPARVVERIGLHQSNHEGARDLDVAPTAAASIVLPSRGRLSGLRSAADVVVAPGTQIRSPVTGTVVRAGSYVLYCTYADDFVIIEPDGLPGWEVKVLHITGVAVQPGDRLIGGLTVIAPQATQLPFRSQVDAHTASPSWPHTHIEVIDPDVPDVPNPGSGSNC
ncbi:hypothetical protein BH23ACT9_BH23ACT9_20780 [soil metagenome]